MATAIELSSQDIHGLCQRYLREIDETSGNSAVNNTTEKSPTNVTFEVVNYKLQSTSDAPSGYLGRHLFLIVDVLIKNGKATTNKSLCFFSKSAPNGVESHMAYVEEFGVFKKEIEVYKTMLPKLQSLCAEVAPKCYYADNNLLVFENLTDQGYRMGASRDGILDYEHLHCTLKTLATMHAGSIIYEQRMGKKINEAHAAAVVENSYPSNLPDEHMRMMNFNNANTVMKEIIKIMPKYAAHLDYILANFTPNMAKIFEYVKPSKKYKNCFSHGDLWANNVMYKYGKYGNTPIECRLVDFQLARYAPPVIDLLTILTIPTTRAFREKYMQELLSEYYRFLKEFLKRADVDINEHIPESQYYASIEEFRIIGLIESGLFCHLTALPTTSTQALTQSADGFSDFFDRKRVQICMEAYQTDEIYRERLNDILEDFIDTFILKEKL